MNTVIIMNSSVIKTGLNVTLVSYVIICALGLVSYYISTRVYECAYVCVCVRVCVCVCDFDSETLVYEYVSIYIIEYTLTSSYTDYTI